MRHNGIVMKCNWHGDVIKMDTFGVRLSFFIEGKGSRGKVMRQKFLLWPVLCPDSGAKFPSASSYQGSGLQPQTSYLRSAGCSRRERWAENQGSRVQVAQLPPLWSLEALGGERQPGDGMPGVRAAPTLASSLMGPAGMASAQSCSSRLRLWLRVWGAASLPDHLFPISWFISLHCSTFLGAWKFFFFISSSSVSFSQALSTCPWKNVVKFEMALILEKWLFLIYAMPIFKKVLKAPRVWHVLNMKLKNKKLT